MSDDDLGFGSTPTKKALDVSDFKPKKIAPIDDDAGDKAAERAGFTSREPVERVERVRKKPDIQDTLYVRGPIQVTNRFKDFCNREGMSYGEALDHLMKKAKI